MVSSVSSGSKKRLLVLPFRAVLYFGCSVLIVLLLLACIDRFLLPELVRKGELPSAVWKDHNERVFKFITQKNCATADDPIWRSASHPVSPEANGKKRILVMGDSFVWGDGLANMNDIWWQQLQNELKTRGYNDVEVIAAGKCGASTRMELDWAKKIFPIYKPDMVIFGYVTNDPDEGSDEAGEGIVKQMKKGPDDSEFAEAFGLFEDVFPNLAYQLKGLRARKLMDEASGPTAYSYSDWELKILEGENFKAYTNTVQNLADFAKSAAVPCFMFTLPMPQESARARFAPVEKLYKEHGVPFVNNLDAMLDWYKKNRDLSSTGMLKMRVSPVNGHPALASTHFYAVQAADYIEKNFADKLGPKTAAKPAAGVTVNDWAPPVLGVTNPKPGIFAMYYPSEENLFLLMPMERPYVQLNLTEPKAIKEIHIIGKNLKSASLALRVGEAGNMANTATIKDFGSKKGNGCIFRIPADRLTGNVDEVLVSADFNGEDRQVLVECIER